MRKLLNTLYVTTPEAYLSKDGLNVVVSQEKEEIFRIPIVNIEGIVTFGYMGASPGLMRLCVENGVSLVFMTPSGRYICRIQGGVKGNVLLRQRQYEWAKDENISLHLSRMMVSAKIHNYAGVLKRYVRDYGNNEEVAVATRQMTGNQRKALTAADKDLLRGQEGDAANKYFDMFPKLILNSDATFSFNGRNRRPPKDAVNAMLSFVYTLLANECASALESVGLDPHVGFMHSVRPGRASLALDLMEEFRAYLGDRLVLSLINRKQVVPNDFKHQGDDSVIMTDNCRKTIIKAWQTRKKQEIMHPYLQEKIPIGLLPYAQALLLARFMRGDLDDYPVFLI